MAAASAAVCTLHPARCRPRKTCPSLLPMLQPSLTLVCSRWRHVYFSEPALWRSLELNGDDLHAAAKAGQAAEWFSTQRALLQRIGSFLTELSVVDGCEVEVAGEWDWQQGVMQRMA